MLPLRTHQSYLAALGHRLSGLALSLFLPFHFLLLGSALDGEEALARHLVFTEQPMVKLAEWGLVVLLALHLFFGLRVLRLEFTRWPNHAKAMNRWVIPGVLASALVGFLFILQVR